jgi:hypothetical protein
MFYTQSLDPTQVRAFSDFPPTQMHCNRLEILYSPIFIIEDLEMLLNHRHKEDFAAAGCQHFIVSGTEYGEIRQFGNFSFLEIYEIGLATGFFWKLNTRIDH